MSTSIDINNGHVGGAWCTFSATSPFVEFSILYSAEAWIDWYMHPKISFLVILSFLLHPKNINACFSLANTIQACGQLETIFHYLIKCPLIRMFVLVFLILLNLFSYFAALSLPYNYIYHRKTQFQILYVHPMYFSLYEERITGVLLSFFKDPIWNWNAT